MQPVRRGSKDLIREINESIVLGELRSHPLSSRTDIARRTGLSLPTVSGITGRLIEAGLVEERETGVSIGGRRPVLLALRPEAGYVVGIKLTESKVIAVLTDLEATVVGRHVVETSATTVDAVVAAIVAAVRTLTPSAGRAPVHGVGVGLAGVIDREAGLVRHATYAHWRDVDLGGLLESTLDLPIVVDNDVNALVASEQWFGAGRGVADFAVVSIGRGVGLGLVLDGRIYRGGGGGAGELGHVKVLEDGPLCACGGRGCLEALVGEPAICTQVTAGLGRLVDIETAVRLARDGDSTARSVFARAGRLLGTATANLVNVLNPSRVVLVGEGTGAGDLFMEDFEAALRDGVFPPLRDDLEVIVDEWDDEAWARGAASLLLGELFQPKLRPAEASRPTLNARSAS